MLVGGVTLHLNHFLFRPQLFTGVSPILGPNPFFGRHNCYNRLTVKTNLFIFCISFKHFLKIASFLHGVAVQCIVQHTVYQSLLCSQCQFNYVNHHSTVMRTLKQS